MTCSGLRDGVPLQHRLGPDARGLYGNCGAAAIRPTRSAYVELAERD